LVPVTALVVQKEIFGMLVVGGAHTAAGSPAAACPPPYWIACLRVVCGLAGVVQSSPAGRIRQGVGGCSGGLGGRVIRLSMW
jgi:hypothetical protein